jgi:nucleotide-binding universal stress UspA family protein
VIRISHILVATDLTDRSDRAIERALQLQGQTGATLTLLHVIEPGLTGWLEAHRRSDAEAFLGDRIARLPGEVRSHCSHQVAIGDAFSTIAGEAQAQRAGLIMLGEPGKYRFADLFVGTTADRVVRASPITVLVVKRGSPGPYQRVLAPFDLSEGARNALKTALTIAPHAEVRIVHAWRPPLTALAQRSAATDAIRKENEEIRALIERVAKEALAHSASPGRVLNVDMIEDNPYVVLRNETGWPDLLAMGTHARGRLSTGMIGNLARHMLAEAPCDVLVAGP